MKKVRRIVASAESETIQDRLERRIKEVSDDFSYLTDGLLKVSRLSADGDFTEVALDQLNKFDAELQKAIEDVASTLSE